jgi:hypothetical protein
MKKYCYAQTFGYGKNIKNYSSDPGHHEVKCKIGGFLWKSPLYFICECEPHGCGYSITERCEFFTGITLSNLRNDDTGSNGIWVDYYDQVTEVSAVEFERKIQHISEKRRRKIAAQVRKYNDLAVKLYNTRKKTIAKKHAADSAAEKRLKQAKHY